MTPDSRGRDSHENQEGQAAIIKTGARKASSKNIVRGWGDDLADKSLCKCKDQCSDGRHPDKKLGGRGSPPAILLGGHGSPPAILVLGR